MLELENSYSSIAIAFDNPLNITVENKNMPILKNIAKESNLSAFSWKEIENELFKMKQTKSGFSVVIMFFIFIIAIVGVTNTMVMAMTERKNEVAMLRTLGYKNSYIKALFTIEGGFIGILGAILGLISGLAITSYFQINGIDFTNFADDIDMGYRVNMIMYAALDINKTILICLVAILFCIIAAYIAVRKATTHEIAEELRSI